MEPIPINSNQKILLKKVHLSLIMERSTKDSGTLMPVIVKVAVHKFGGMVPNLSGIGKMIKQTEKEG